MKKKNYKIDISGDKSGAKGIIQLEGDLSIINSKEIYEELKVSYNKFNHLTLKLKDVDNLDLSVVQLLYAIESEYSKKDKTVVIEAELDAEFKELFGKAGFEKLSK